MPQDKSFTPATVSGEHATSLSHGSKQETIIILPATRLNDGGIYPVVLADHLDQVRYVGVSGRRTQHSRLQHLPDHVVDIDHAPSAAGQLDGPVKVGPLVVPVGIDEDDVEFLSLALGDFLGQVGEDVERRAQDDVDLLGHLDVAVLQVLDGHGASGRVDLDAGQLAAGVLEALGEPQGRVTAQRADLEHVLGPRDAREEGNEFALARRQGYLGDAVGAGVGVGVRKGRRRWAEGRFDVLGHVVGIFCVFDRHDDDDDERKNFRCGGI